jgi:hypothetical protein
MTQNHKYLGMTATQIGILVGLVGIACLLFALIVSLVFRGTSTPFASNSQSTPVLQSTSTPFVIPNPTPTETPTLIPYEQRIPLGWKQFKTELVEIWLPSDFELADADKLAEDARKRYEEMGLQELIDYNAKSKAIPVLVVTDEESGSPLYRTISTISYQPLNGESLDVFIDNELSELPSMLVLVERRKVQIGSIEAVRLVYEMRQGNIYANDVSYIFVDGNKVWSVGYYAEITEFYQQLPSFEQSIQTFRIIK